MQSAPKPEHVAVGAQIRSVLDELGISGNELAKRLGWPQSNVARRLLGKTPTTVPELQQIADTIGVPVSRLLPEQTAAGAA